MRTAQAIDSGRGARSAGAGRVSPARARAGERSADDYQDLVVSHTAHFFGPFRVYVDGQLLRESAWRRTSARTLLKWLLLNPGEPFGSEHLCSILWPGVAAERTARSLSVTLHCLRHLLEPQLGARQTSTFIRSDDRKNYWFDFAGRWSTDVEDVWDLHDVAHKAERRDERHVAISAYQRLLPIYARSFLPEDVYEDCFADHRHEHEVAHTRAESRLMRLCLSTGQLPNALAAATAALARQASNLDAATTIVEVYRRQDNLTGAIRQIDELIRRSEREFGTADRDLVALRRSLLRS